MHIVPPPTVLAPMHLSPLRARDPHEPHRVATPLELFFDLVIVIAVAAATEVFHHAIAEGHGLAMLPNFVFLFVAIWWTWMNFTWFASSFDNDDTLYRSLVFCILIGALLFAGGVAHIVETLDFRYGLLGWVVMRVGMIGLWLRAARGSNEHRLTARTYAAGIALAQAGWVLLYVLVPAGSPAFWGFGMACFLLEFAVPVMAQRQGHTPWHRHHLAERYGLLTIIVLGEVLLSISRAFGLMYEAGTPTLALAVSAQSGLTIVFALFSTYFTSDEHLTSLRFRRVLEWGYGHVVFFGAVAALGAGLAADTDVAAHTAHVSGSTIAWFVGVPLALAWATLWTIRDRHLDLGWRGYALLAVAAGALVLAAVGAPVWAFAVLSLALHAARVPLRRAPGGTPGGRPGGTPRPGA